MVTNLVNGIAVDSLKNETFIGIVFTCPGKIVGLTRIRISKRLLIAEKVFLRWFVTLRVMTISNCEIIKM